MAEFADVVGIDGAAHEVAQMNQYEVGGGHICSIIGGVDLGNSWSIEGMGGDRPHLMPARASTSPVIRYSDKSSL